MPRGASPHDTLLAVLDSRLSRAASWCVALYWPGLTGTQSYQMGEHLAALCQPFDRQLLYAASQAVVVLYGTDA